MKKTVKKVISVALAVLMLVSVCGVQSFAAFDLFKSITVTDIVLSDTSCNFVSMKELKAAFKEGLAYIEELEELYEMSFEEFLQSLEDDGFSIEMYEDLFNFYLSYSFFDYKYTATLSNGEVITKDAWDNVIEVNSRTTISVDCYITYDDYLEAKENNADKVKLTFIASNYNKLKSEFVKNFTKQDEIDAVPCVVKSIKPVSGVPSRLYKTYNYIDLEGAKFKIRYNDGTTKTATVSQELIVDEEFGFTYMEYTLDGNPLYCMDNYYDAEEDGPSLIFSYIDANYSTPVTFKTATFKSVKINDCVYDAENGLQSVTYTIKWKNGDSKKYTKEINNVKEVGTYFVVDCIDSHYVYVETTLASVDWYNSYDEIEGEKLRVYVTVGDKVSSPVEFEAPEQEESEGVLAKLMNLLSGIIEMFQNLIATIFGG